MTWLSFLQSNNIALENRSRNFWSKSCHGDKNKRVTCCHNLQLLFRFDHEQMRQSIKTITFVASIISGQKKLNYDSNHMIRTSSASLLCLPRFKTLTIYGLILTTFGDNQVTIPGTFYIRMMDLISMLRSK